MKELLDLYLVFFKMGIVNFGGGYAMLPLLERELVEKRGWVTTEEITDYYAVGQCTPGAIAVNVSTFIGAKRKGVLGGIAATLGFVSPAFIIIFLIATVLTNISDNPFVISALAGIRAAVAVLVFQAILKLSKKSIKDIPALILAVGVAALAIFVDVIPLYAYVIFAAIFGIVYHKIKEGKKKQVEPTDEVKEEAKPDVKEKKSNKDAIHLVIGLIVGLVIGFLGIIAYPFVKSKSYLKGVLATSMLFLIMAVCLLVALIFNDGTMFILYFQLFKIGFCAFGGGLATIPFLSELGASTGWFSKELLANMIAVSESTPGAIGINMSTYIGYTVSNVNYDNMFVSFIGSIISTLGLVSPSIIVILIVSVFLNKFKTNKYVEYAFYGLRAASIGLIIAAFYSILKVSVIDVSAAEAAADSFIKVKTIYNLWDNVGSVLNAFFRWPNLCVALFIGVLVFKYKKHPIFYICIAAVLGIMFHLL